MKTTLYACALDAPAQRAVALRLNEPGWTAPGDTAISVHVLQEMRVDLGRRGECGLHAEHGNVAAVLRHGAETKAEYVV